MPRHSDLEGHRHPSEVATNILNVGAKTFFQRNQRWEDSSVTEEQLKNVKQIERYSDEYFALSQKFGKEAAKYFAIEGKVVVVLEGQAYEF